MTLHIKHVEPYTRLGIEVNYIVMTSSLEVYELSNELGVLDVISEHSPCTVKGDKMRKVERENKTYHEWMNPFNADRNQHMLKQRIIKLCLESRKKEIKYDLNSSYYLLNSLVTVSKKAVHDWLKNSDMKTLFIDDVENNVLCGIDMSDVTKIS